MPTRTYLTSCRIALIAAPLWATSFGFGQPTPSKDGSSVTAAAIATAEARAHERQEVRRSAVKSLGKHWSELDRVVLSDELDAGDTGAAEKRIVAAAKQSVRQGALWLLLIELNSTDTFAAYRDQLRNILRAQLEERTIPGAGAFSDGTKAEAEEYLVAHVYEHILNDYNKAEECYTRLLGKTKSDEIGQRPDKISDHIKGLSPSKRAAAERVLELRLKKRG